jgi:hypothetical protein
MEPEAAWSGGSRTGEREGRKTFERLGLQPGGKGKTFEAGGRGSRAEFEAGGRGSRAEEQHQGDGGHEEGKIKRTDFRGG